MIKYNGAIQTNAKYRLILIRRFFHVLWRYIKHTFDPGRYKIYPIPALYVETTNTCSSNCVCCPNTIMKRQRQHMSMIIFEKAIDEFVDMGGNSLNFCACIGEPTLDPYLLARARYVRKYPQIKNMEFFTNLQGFHKFDIDEFFDSGINILSISVVLSGPEKYREFFGVDMYDVVLGNLAALLTENKRRNNKIRIHIDMKPTNEPIDTIIHHSDFRFINSLIDEDLIKQAKQQYYVMDNWGGAVNLPRYLVKRPLYPRFFRPCLLLLTSAMIFSNGNIGLCPCRDFNADSELILGNIKESSMKELLQSEQKIKIITNWRNSNNIPQICKSCSHYVY